VAQVAKNPMKRALRVDKIRLAALEATLKLYRDPDRLPERLPTLRMFTLKEPQLREMAGRLQPAVEGAVGANYAVTVAACSSQIGSGALPLETLPSAGIAIRARDKKHEGSAAERLSRALRRLDVPVVGRIRDNAMILDLRCLDDEALFLVQLAALPKRLAAEEGRDVLA